ncbi:MAG: PP2C family protein-serine/threonine phosphatase [Polyangiaceae bacterium]
MGFLPKRLPSFAGATNLDVFVYIKPMYEVGGDFYNLAPIGEQRLFFTIVDVADKGIPAALFMARAVTAFDISKGTGTHVYEAMSAVNRTLCSNNESRMFTTAMAAVIDVATGEVEYSDGGHEPPFVVRADGRVELIDKKSGLALGFLPDFPFFSERLKLDPGDALIFYTDGLTEAMDTKRNLFGAERIQRTLEVVSKGSSELIGRGLLERVESFVGAAPQSDDRTLVIVRYAPQQTDRTDLPEEITA